MRKFINIEHLELEEESSEVVLLVRHSDGHECSKKDAAVVEDEIFRRKNKRRRSFNSEDGLTYNETVGKKGKEIRYRNYKKWRSCSNFEALAIHV